MEQILINLVTGALGGAGAGKASPQFDLGMIGNLIAGAIGGGVLGQIVTLSWPSVVAAAQSGNFSVGGYIANCRWWCRRCHPHGNTWRNGNSSGSLIWRDWHGTCSLRRARPHCSVLGHRACRNLFVTQPVKCGRAPTRATCLGLGHATTMGHVRTLSRTQTWDRTWNHHPDETAACSDHAHATERNARARFNEAHVVCFQPGAETGPRSYTLCPPKVDYAGSWLASIACW